MSKTTARARGNPLHNQTAEFLRSLGLSEPEKDPLLHFATTAARNSILNSTNQHELCQDLFDIAVFRAAGEYLRLLHAAGKLDAEAMVIADDAVKQIKEGEVSVTFFEGEMNFAQLIDWLSTYGADGLGRFRRMQW
jgi:hypothetical protein